VRRLPASERAGLSAGERAGERAPLSGQELEHLVVRNMLNDAAEAIYFKDLQSRFIAVSRTLATLHGRGAPAQPRRTPIGRLNPPPPPPA